MINGNGFIKEYRFGLLQYEGEYLNGERNGKGKEYYRFSGKLEFEGEYLNRKKWNGKGYGRNNNIEYELKNGKGLMKEYDEDDEVKYEGEYLNGEKNGKGKKYDMQGKLRLKVII